MRHLAELAATLVAGDPVGQAGKVLRRFLSVSRGRGAALLCQSEDDLRVLVATNLALSELHTLESALKRQAQSLRHGKTISGDDYQIVPLVEEGRFVGALYVQGAGDLRFGLYREYLVILTKAVVAAMAPRGLDHEPSDLVGLRESETLLSEHDVKKELTLGTLRRCDWNIAEVSRQLGITRRTIYLRLARWGVRRQYAGSVAETS